MNYFITYDISQDKLRNKIAKHLEKSGFYRLQKSVFFIRKPSEKELEAAKDLLREYMEDSEEGDSLLVIPVEQQTDGVEVMGDSPEYKKVLQIRKSWYF